MRIIVDSLTDLVPCDLRHHNEAVVRGDTRAARERTPRCLTPYVKCSDVYSPTGRSDQPWSPRLRKATGGQEVA